MAAIAIAGALVAWLGAATAAVSDGRRALALGLMVTAVGLAAANYEHGGAAEAAALLAGGVVAAALRLRDGPPGWRVMPPGSTPRIILSLLSLAGGGLVGIWLTSGPGAAARVGALSVCTLTLARVMTADRRLSALVSASTLALALGTLGGLGAAATGAAVAAALSALPAERPQPERTETAGHGA